MGEMIFNGISTEDMGVVIQAPPVYEFPSRDYEVIHIPGKSGDVLIDNGSYLNVKRTYYLASVFRPNTSFVANANAIVSWLMSAKGYVRLEDSYESEYYRLAMFRNPGQMVNMWDKATTLPVTFECKPQRFLKSGEIEKEVTQLDTYIKIVNPTDYIATPEIVIEGSLDLVIDMYSGDDYNTPDNTSQVDIEFAGEGVINSELEDCYNDTEYLNNDVIITNGFPKLYPGVNWIKVSGTTLMNCKVKPNWWTL
jgi:phage-related protein